MDGIDVFSLQKYRPLKLMDLPWRVRRRKMKMRWMGNPTSSSQHKNPCQYNFMLRFQPTLSKQHSTIVFKTNRFSHPLSLVESVTHVVQTVLPRQRCLNPKVLKLLRSHHSGGFSTKTIK